MKIHLGNFQLPRQIGPLRIIVGEQRRRSSEKHGQRNQTYLLYRRVAFVVHHLPHLVHKLPLFSIAQIVDAAAAASSNLPKNNVFLTVTFPNSAALIPKLPNLPNLARQLQSVYSQLDVNQAHPKSKDIPMKTTRLQDLIQTAFFSSALILTLTFSFASSAKADIFNDLIDIEVDDVSAGADAIASAYGVSPSATDLELEHSGAGGYDVDINPLGGCDFLLTIGHHAPVGGVPVGLLDWEITDIHMRDSEGNEMFAKITGVEIPPGGLTEMPTIGIAFTDWVVVISTGEFPSSATGSLNDYIVRVAVIGDVNEDCKINLLDVDPFVELLVNDGYSTQADINQDGALDLLDVSEFVSLLSE